MPKRCLIFILLVVLSCKSNEFIPDTDIQAGSLQPVSEGEIIEHTYYSLAYSEVDEQPYWVFYHLTPELINGDQERTDDYREDPLVITGSATLDDYRYSGYDRGHLCPAADMKLNETSMSESFYLSNMSPQEPGFNRGIWSTLEEDVRDWTLEYNGLYIVTGGILTSNKGTIGENEVSIPEKYYKVLYADDVGMIGFILPNEGSSQALWEFRVSVDSIETLTGIDFFSGLDDQIEDQYESNVNMEIWFSDEI